MLAYINLENEKKWCYWNQINRSFIPVPFRKGLERLFAEKSVVPLMGRVKFFAPFGGSKIMAVGRNYKSHAKELGNQIPNEPLWFQKPPSSIVGNKGKVKLPKGFGRIDYEGELAIVIGRKSRQVPLQEALKQIAGITLALDITARDLQKSDGQWTRAKGFDTFCPLGPWIVPFQKEWQDVAIKTVLNGKIVQSDRTSSMVFGFAELIRHLSACMTLEPGDIILTGTPAGVGSLKEGDQLVVEAVGPSKLSLEVHCES